MTEIRVYVEGGGTTRQTRALCREGFDAFLAELKARAHGRCGWRVIASGGRDNAIEDFQVALRANPDAFNVLLIDSEEPVNPGYWQRLRSRLPRATGEDQCHLMVQAMEAWLIADPASLEAAYGQRFNARALPVTNNVELIEQVRLEPALKQATRETTRGEYRKGRDGPDLLKHLDPTRVRTRAPHCQRLFDTLHTAISNC